MKRNRRCSGTTLVITLALLAALAIIGTTMISLARMDRFAARSYRLDTQMDLAADASLEWFGARWAEAYWNRAVPYYPASGTATTATPLPYPSAWNSYDVVLPGCGTTVASRGDSTYDADSLVTLLPNSSGTASITGGVRFSNNSPCYKLTPLVKNETAVTNVPTGASNCAWPIPNPGGEMAYVYPELRFPAGPNKTVEVSLTAVDLCGRLNLNFTGSSIPPMGGALTNTICGSWHGASIQEVWPPATIISTMGLQSITGGITNPGGRWGGTLKGPELIDGTMNPFAPGVYDGLADKAPGVASPAVHPLPFSLEDLSDLLNISGAQSTTGLGTFTSRLANTAGAGTPYLTSTAANGLNRTMVTTHSWTSAARRYYNAAGTIVPAVSPNETIGALCVKADLNNAPQADLERALLATRIFNTANPTDMTVMEQIVANIMDYRRDCNPSPTGATHTVVPAQYRGHPTAITPAIANITMQGNANIHGVQRQPFVNEVYVNWKDANGTTPQGVTKANRFDVWIQLANPYDQALNLNDEYTKLSIGGDGGNDLYATPYQTYCTGPLTAMPPTIAKAPGPGLAAGAVVGTIITIDSRATWAVIQQHLQPIRLYNTDTNGNLVLVDRMVDSFNPSFTSSASLQPNTTSVQRPTYAGLSHAGVAQQFFGGFMESPPGPPGPIGYDIMAAPSTAMTTVVGTAGSDTTSTGCPSVSNATATTGAVNRVRPIENRSRTWHQNGTTPVRTRAFYPAWGAAPGSIPELSFASVGDLCRLLIIGPGFGYQATSGGGGNFLASGTLGYIAASQSSGTGTIWTVTEQLGAVQASGILPILDESDCHIDIAKISTRTSTSAAAGGNAPYDWRRLLDVFNVNSPYYDGLDNSGQGQVVDNQQASTLTNSAQYVVGELYEHGRINLLTAPQAVVQAMMTPLQYIAPAAGDTYAPADLTNLTTFTNRSKNITQPIFKSPADILDLSSKWAQGLFITNNKCDDDGNGAYGDYAKKCWLYTYISNWATIRSDCMAVYGTVRLTDTSTSPVQTQGLRHFVAVMDRVPATAFQPFLFSSTGLIQPNPYYQPPRRLLLTWLD
jgi:hypothetical protein